MITSPFRIELDDRHELRLLTLADADAVFKLVDLNREMLREWLPWLDYNRTVEDSQTFINKCLENFEIGKGTVAGIWMDHRLAGVISYNFPVDVANRKLSIGYWVGREFQGKGLVKRATRAMVTHAFERLDFNRVEILCATGNLKSQSIPRALEFTEEGVLRQYEWLYDRFVDLKIYSMLAEDYEAKFAAKFRGAEKVPVPQA
ncbi:MAG: GNAT family N-acetyltransferase [Methylotenera sp.]|nr:GNAT family N-acetyltransferase [Oligoflexia bacterium]